MNFKYLIAATILTAPLLMQAVNADPRVRTVINPDGSTVEVRVHGNEYFHFMTDSDKTILMEKDSRGFYVQMQRNNKPLDFNQENIDMLRMEAEALNPVFAETHDISGRKRMAALDGTARTTYPTIGVGNRSLVVLVEFSDVNFTVENPKEYFTRQLNEPGFSDYGGNGSALDYYKDASNGLYVPQFDVYGPVKINYEASYFEDLSANMKYLIQESLTALDDEIDFSNYDLDDNGTIDTVFFYYAGYGSADSETATIWPHQGNYQNYVNFKDTNHLILDGKKMGPYACANELKGWNPTTNKQPWLDNSEPWVDGIGAFVHEYGHVLGLPDLYDVNKSGDTVTPGEWDVMCSGNYNGEGCCPPLFSAYEQWVCRWLEFTDVSDGTHYDLKALGNSETSEALRIRIPKTSSANTFYDEYFVVEARDKSKWDICFPESGIQIWRINYKKDLWKNNAVNTNGVSNVEILYADGEENPLYNNGNIYPGSANELIPSTKYQWWVSPYITYISYDEDSKTASFDYNVMTETPTGAPVLHDNPYADKGSARNFTIEWDPVDGADSYQVTIRRVSNGNILGLYDEFNVGDETSIKVFSVAPAFWNNEIEAYVRAVKCIPCSDISNIIRFVPKELPKGASVESIEDSDAVISGGVGCVNAPDGSEIYNMSGQKVCKDNLPSGVYLVIFKSRVKKVVVK